MLIETLQEAHSLKDQHGRSPAEVFQLAFAVSNAQYLVKETKGKKGNHY